jgi:hypothetical protein
VKEFAKKVRLAESTSVDAIPINRDYYFRNAYTVDLPLETTPDHVWQDIFDREWKSSRHLWDRKLFIMGDKLRLVTTVNDIEDKLDWVKQVIERTNMDIDEYNREAEAREAQTECEMRSRTPEDEKISVDTIRGSLRKRFGTF